MSGVPPLTRSGRPQGPGAGRTAVVTGASSGIGAATATRLAAEGFDVVLGARRMDRLTGLADSIGARALPLDVTDPASVEAFAAALARVDVLVNNAGGAFDGNPVAEADLDSWARLSLLTRYWARIESFASSHPVGPWWLSLTPSGPHELPYAAMSSSP